MTPSAAPGSEPGRERGEQAGIIIGEVDRLDSLVNDITFMVRMDSRAVTLSPRPVKALALLRKVAGRFVDDGEKRGVSIRIDTPARLLMDADEQRIMQVLDNLLSNALRHTPMGGNVLLRARQEPEGIRVEVLKTGDPIPAEHLPRLFEPFYRVDEARSKERGGSGLGLAIVQGTVAAYGGSCGVENTPEGVLFWFTVPERRPMGMSRADRVITDLLEE